jgi:hypothetical protein
MVIDSDRKSTAKNTGNKKNPYKSGLSSGRQPNQNLNTILPAANHNLNPGSNSNSNSGLDMWNLNKNLK